MKHLELSDATAPLAQYAKATTTAHPLILTKKGKPVAAVISLKGVDKETLAMSQNPRFLSILDKSRARRRREGGISSDEMRKRLGMPSK
jgi:prevent-host-death family protein